jgi:hypothetical protein
MSIDMPALVRPVLTGASASDVSAIAPILRINGPRPVAEDELPRDVWTEPLAADAASADAQRTQRAQRITPGALRYHDNWDEARPRYNRTGAPSDAAPALSRLEARIGAEPAYLHHYASARYAAVSYLPWMNADRRRHVDVLA